MIKKLLLIFSLIGFGYGLVIHIQTYTSTITRILEYPSLLWWLTFLIFIGISFVPELKLKDQFFKSLYFERPRYIFMMVILVIIYNAFCSTLTQHPFGEPVYENGQYLLKVDNKTVKIISESEFKHFVSTLTRNHISVIHMFYSFFVLVLWPTKPPRVAVGHLTSSVR